MHTAREALQSNSNPLAILSGIVQCSIEREIQYQAAIAARSGVGAYLSRGRLKAIAMRFGIASSGDARAMVQPAALVIAENSMLGRICSGSRLVRILGVWLLGYAVSV
jgi:hypothetical protein